MDNAGNIDGSNVQAEGNSIAISGLSVGSNVCGSFVVGNDKQLRNKQDFIAADTPVLAKHPYWRNQKELDKPSSFQLKGIFYSLGIPT